MRGDVTNKFGIFSTLKFAAISVLYTVECAKDKDCVKFGAQFDIPLQSKNIRNDCTLPDGRPVCCAAVLSNSTYIDDHTISSRGVGYTHHSVQMMTRTSSLKGKVKSSCSITKTYISSPQEERDLHISLQLDKIADTEMRLESLMKYITSDEMLSNSTKWLERVSVHMRSEVIPQGNFVDKEFLSRFHVTRKCAAGNGTDRTIDSVEWDEWIEPVNIAARHPFAFSRCRPTSKYFRGKPGTGFDRSDVDYVLLQSGAAIADQGYVPGRFPFTISIVIFSFNEMRCNDV
jgi:hypothetical protein